MVAGNGYATGPAGSAICWGRRLWMGNGERGTGNGGTPKRQFRNDPLGLHHTEAPVGRTLRVSAAIPGRSDGAGKANRPPRNRPGSAARPWTWPGLLRLDPTPLRWSGGRGWVPPEHGGRPAPRRLRKTPPRPAQENLPAGPAWSPDSTPETPPQARPRRPPAPSRPSGCSFPDPPPGPQGRNRSR